jgi:hypothetical protein
MTYLIVLGKKVIEGQAWCLTSVLLATWETDIKRIMVRNSSPQDPISKQWLGMVAHALSSQLGGEAQLGG